MRTGRPRGNPTWGKGGGKIKPASPTAFELMADSLNVEPSAYPYSTRLKRWVQANYKRRYVPEDLLRTWGMDLDAGNLSGREEAI